VGTGFSSENATRKDRERMVAEKAADLILRDAR